MRKPTKNRKDPIMRTFKQNQQNLGFFRAKIDKRRQLYLTELKVPRLRYRYFITKENRSINRDIFDDLSAHQLHKRE